MSIRKEKLIIMMNVDFIHYELISLHLKLGTNFALTQFVPSKFV